MIERNGPITVNKEFENSPVLRNLVKDLGIIKELTSQLIEITCHNGKFRCC